MRLRFVSLLALAGCTTRAPLAMEVDRGVPAGQFAMRITETTPLSGDHPIEMIWLALSPGNGQHVGSAGRPLWFTAHVRGQPYLHAPLRLRLTDSIPGYASLARPPLVLGRYVARVSAGGVIASTSFRVNERGRIE